MLVKEQIQKSLAENNAQHHLYGSYLCVLRLMPLHLAGTSHTQRTGPAWAGKASDSRMAEAGRHSWRWSRPTSAQSKGSKIRLFRTVDSWVLSSSKYGDFTTSVGNLFHSLTTFMVKLDNKIKYFHLFKWNFLPICAHSLLPPMRRV